MENPFREIRMAKGFNLHEYGMVLNLSREYVYRLENGYVANISPRIVKALDKIGYNGQEVAENYLSWRASIKESLQNSSKEGNL